MADTRLHYSWQWNMPAPPQQVWPLVSDTHAFNRAVGVGPWSFTETPDPLGGSVREGASRSLGARVTWDENPFHWIERREFSVLREFHNGPFLRVLSHLDLQPTRTGSTLTYRIEVAPRSLLWGIFARYYIGVHSRRHFDRVFTNIAKYLAQEVDVVYPEPATSLSKGAIHRLRTAEAALVGAGFDQGLARRVIRHVEEEPDDACHRIKPYAIADMTGEDREDVLRLCLHATRLGILELTWDLMCPLCRGAKERVSTLSDLRGQAHCSSCNIQFDANFDRSVEITFRPSQQVRRLEPTSYCVGGPGNTPHIAMQRTLAPGDSVITTINLADGTYRLRGPKMDGSAMVEVKASYSALESITFSCNREGVMPQYLEVPPGETHIRLENSGEMELLVLLEGMQWPADAVTWAEVTALQDFRDLFSSEVLDPQEQFQVRYLAFMFTDLRSSTALYRQKGDAPAFALVRDHFQVLHDLVARHHGAVVKTIGDAVMAVFRDPRDAIAAGLDIHDAFTREGARDPDIVLKIGIHAGPCIAINLNGRLDYFGTTVNATVRLQGHSLGGDLVVSGDLLEDPEVRDVLARPGIRTERLTVRLKGFEEDTEICRITWDVSVPDDDAGGHEGDSLNGEGSG